MALQDPALLVKPASCKEWLPWQRAGPEYEHTVNCRGLPHPGEDSKGWGLPVCQHHDCPRHLLIMWLCPSLFFRKLIITTYCLTQHECWALDTHCLFTVCNYILWFSPRSWWQWGAKMWTYYGIPGSSLLTAACIMSAFPSTLCSRMVRTTVAGP